MRPSSSRVRQVHYFTTWGSADVRSGSKANLKAGNDRSPPFSQQRTLSGRRLERFRAKACPGLDPGWIPVRVKKTRQNKRLEPGSDSIRTDKALVDRMTNHCGEFAHQTLGDLARHRELAGPLEFLDRGLGVRTDSPGRFQLAIAIFRQCALHRRYPA